MPFVLSYVDNSFKNLAIKHSQVLTENSCQLSNMVAPKYTARQEESTQHSSVTVFVGKLKK